MSARLGADLRYDLLRGLGLHQHIFTSHMISNKLVGGGTFCNGVVRLSLPRATVWILDRINMGRENIGVFYLSKRHLHIKPVGGLIMYIGTFMSLITQTKKIL